MQHGSFQNLTMANGTNGQPTPEVGMGCTILSWTDRTAATIVAVKSAKRIIIREDKATRTDKNGMSDCQQYSYETDPNGSESIVTLRKDGKWKTLGGGRTVAIGYRDQHYDFSF